MFYSYTGQINGFAAVLDEEEASQIASRILISLCIHEQVLGHFAVCSVLLCSGSLT